MIGKIGLYAIAILFTFIGLGMNPWLTVFSLSVGFIAGLFDARRKKRKKIEKELEYHRKMLEFWKDSEESYRRIFDVIGFDDSKTMLYKEFIDGEEEQIFLLERKL